MLLTLAIALHFLSGPFPVLERWTAWAVFGGTGVSLAGSFAYLSFTPEGWIWAYRHKDLADIGAEAMLQASVDAMARAAGATGECVADAVGSAADGIDVSL